MYVQIIYFLYIIVFMKKRDVGILLHPTSLPSKLGVGDIGKNAFKFIDKLHDANIGLWQILPLGPTGFGDSPYAARSSFAGNELLIDIEWLYDNEYIEAEDFIPLNYETVRVDYNKAKEIKMPVLVKGAKAFLETKNKDYVAFVKENAHWLEDYALFQVLCTKYNDSRWFSVWPEEVKRREDKALKALLKEYKDEVEIYKVLQYFFYAQLGELRAYAASKNVKIIGDIPIFVAPDSADAWSNPTLLKLDENFNQKVSSGVPPDAFSADGQLWGNPLYNWKEHEKEGFAWWISRIKGVLKQADIVRIDHFRGFLACWEVPAGETTAMNGTWVKAPGKKLLKAIKDSLGSLDIIAEDLGVITPDVEKLRDDNDLPGMKILQFAFGYGPDGKLDGENEYLPHNIGYNTIAYTGTHDNDTTYSWYHRLSDGEKDLVRRYLECSDDDIVYKMIRAILGSNAKAAIIPYQDVLGLDNDARMNLPSTCGSANWSWKMTEEQLNDNNFDRLKYYIAQYARGAKA